MNTMPNFNFTAEKYIKEVIDGTVQAGKLVQDAVYRHIDDLEKSKNEEFRYIFKPEKAYPYIQFAQLLKHTKGEWARQNQSIILEPWQQFILYMIHGWRRKDNGLRRFRKCYIEVARKNGKTTLAAALANGIFFLDGEPGCEIYCAATKRDQARICWTEIENQIRKCPQLNKRVRVYKNKSSIVMGNSFIRPLGADSNTEDGLNPYLGIIDEYHAHKTNQMLEVLESGMGSREQPLSFIITTAGSLKQGPCFTEERDFGIRVLTKRAEDDTFFPLIYELDEGDDWSDINMAIKANPNLGVSVKTDYIEARISEALANPRKQALIRTKNFNQWVDASETWIKDDSWDELGHNVQIDQFAGRDCYMAIDLSNRIDLTALSIVFPRKDIEKQDQIFVKYYMPADIIEEKTRQDNVPYALWRDQGWITCTPGNIVDQDWIEADVGKLIDGLHVNVKGFAYDPWNASQLVTHLSDKGLQMVEFRQGFATMSPASKAFEAAVLNKTIGHDRNPILAWNVQCTEVVQDPAGNIKPNKKALEKSSKRIDGCVASIMAFGLYGVTGEASGEREDDGNVYIV